MDIIYGTSNKEKVIQMREIFKENGINVKLETLKDIEFDEEIIEDGSTFEENSEIKARAIEKFCNNNNITNKLIITDDAGLCVDNLNGEPGIYSARYAGENASQLDKINKVLDKMKQYQDMEDRKCQFVCVLTAINLNTSAKFVARGECKGYVAKEHGKLGGLTYIPIFIPEGYNIPMSEMPEETFEKMHNHRSNAFKLLIEELKERKIIE